jgi:hypothetical protein
MMHRDQRVVLWHLAMTAPGAPNTLMLTEATQGRNQRALG